MIGVISWIVLSFSAAPPRNSVRTRRTVMPVRHLSAAAIAGVTILFLLFSESAHYAQRPALLLNDREYFEMPGLNVMAFQDIYPEGHQSGVVIVQNGVRVSTNGDLRLDPTPGQWQPMPRQDKRVVNKQGNEITTWLSYPDPSRNRKGFNPIDYPDLNLSYQVHVRGEGQSVRIVVDLDRPLPAAFVGKVGFNFELYPAALFGKSWYLGAQSGIFPRQPNGPDRQDKDGEIQPVPMSTGRRLSVAAEAEAQRLIIESRTGDLQLLDGRNKHNNGWFIVRSLVPAGADKAAIEWIVTPNGIADWKYQPVVHVSQVGYYPQQQKIAIIELDNSDAAQDLLHVKRISEDGGFEEVLSGKPADWGKFLRYRYLQFDFTKVAKPGMYVAEYRNFRTQPFQISPDVYKRGTWQPVIEYFLPVQMCHMRVEEQYRVWHGACHLDDARMAPINYNHFDGYQQGSSTLNQFKAGETVPGLNVGGWHDAGDDDLRIESQADEVSILGNAYEAFGVNYDDTTVDENKRLVKIHQPDGKPDVLQQVEHGVLSILGSYRGMGRLYRGIIVPMLQQYVLLGEETNSTDNLFHDSSLKADERSATHSGKSDKKPEYGQVLIDNRKEIAHHIDSVGWSVGKVLGLIKDRTFVDEIRSAVSQSFTKIVERQKANPFGVPYRPVIWGAGWDIQRFGVEQYFLHRAFGDIVSPQYMLNALNFVLGVHPGENTASFASGVGSRSMTIAYGINRADWSYIPGGVASGTALIRPDFPELKDFPYLWQQGEYVLGGGSSNYMFLVLAADQVLNRK